ncbi:MAG: TonB-dependent receptor [Tannerella sp.]|nr:TonB-dependent receptor [Tannerella sp.]
MIQLYAANAFSQSTTVHIRKNTLTLRELISEIEEQTDFLFIFSKDDINIRRQLNIKTKSRLIGDILSDAFKNSDITYTFTEQYITLRKINETEKIALAAGLQQARKRIAGTVVDANDEPVIGANIKEKGSTNGTITDPDGNFSLNVAENAVLQISYIGYIPQEISVLSTSSGDSDHLLIKLLEDSQTLDEVVVVGYGVAKKATVTGSIAQVPGIVLKQSPAANLSNSLVGRLPGVIANNRTGEPGNDYSEIYIRGKGTFGDNSPLYVIDGVANRGNIERLNPTDIESVTVLKDASAGIYGAQAANGVILITTKRGNNTKPIITYEGNFGLSENTRTPQLMNAYQYMVYDDEINAHFGRTQTYKDIKNGYLDGTIDPLQFANTDWMSTLFRAAPQTQHSLSLRGGNEKVKYYVSGGYLYQEPGYKKTSLNFNTMQVRSNIDAKVTDDLAISLDIALRQENRNNSNYDSGTFFWEALCAYPFIHDYYPNGLPGPGISWGNNLCILTQGKTGYDRIKDNFMNTKIAIDLRMPWIVDGLYLSGYIAYDIQFRNEKKLNDQWDVYRYNASTGEYENIRPATGDGYINLSQRSDDNRISTTHFKLGYEKRWEEHSLNAFIAYEQSKTTGDWFSAYRRDYLSSNVDYLFTGSDNLKDNNGSATISARQNYFGRLSYGFQDKYLAEFTLRYDGSLNFAHGTRWGLFPGLSLGWRISEENFFKKKVRFVEDLKIRASWGKLGNDRISAFQYLDTYNMGDGALFGYDPQRTKGFTIGRLANPAITWENVDTKNIGFESILLNRKISFDVEYFYSLRTNILTPKQASVPLYTGITLPDQNIGEISNRGIETSLLFKNKAGKINYYIGGNLTFSRNKINFFDEAVNTPEWQVRTGYSMDSWLVYKTDGLYQTPEEITATPHLMNTQPGDIKYVDVDGDGEITDNDMVRIYYGNIPQIVYGINMGANWRGFELNVLWTGQGRVRQMIRPSTLNKYIDYYNERWISATETPNAKYPRAFANNDSFNMKDSEFWLRDASFIRLKNIELAYNVPSGILDKYHISSLRIYLNGFNLFSIDRIKVQDPESNNTGGTFYPQQRIYNMGINISF